MYTEISRSRVYMGPPSEKQCREPICLLRGSTNLLIAVNIKMLAVSKDKTLANAPVRTMTLTELL
jgi:hypothetical protein